MKIYLGTDHRGFEMKEELKARLVAAGHQVEDLGAHQYQADDDYPDVSFAVAEAVAQDESARGILLCGSGVGVNVAANKVKGVRASLAMTPEQASHARTNDDVNVLALSADYLNDDQAMEIVNAFLRAEFLAEGRLARRLQKIEDYEALS